MWTALGCLCLAWTLRELICLSRSPRRLPVTIHAVEVAGREAREPVLLNPAAQRR